VRRQGERERKNKKVKLRQSVQEIRLGKEEEEEGLCDIHDQCARWERLSAWQDHVVLDLDVSAFISCSCGDFVGFNPVPNRTKHQTELIHDPVVRR